MAETPPCNAYRCYSTAYVQVLVNGVAQHHCKDHVPPGARVIASHPLKPGRKNARGNRV